MLSKIAMRRNGFRGMLVHSVLSDAVHALNVDLMPKAILQNLGCLEWRLPWCMVSLPFVRQACALGSKSTTNATWLILPIVICLSQRLSHACVSMN
ncbi:hypothetical protein Fmac_004949 [Flemingia macrophylla]|uniref:Uncharacterized protein n=1 Tax=Flemingia macrophylla TaxID=520843 RepID=A0ABD1N6I8_9FABA